MVDRALPLLVAEIGQIGLRYARRMRGCDGCEISFSVLPELKPVERKSERCLRLGMQFGLSSVTVGVWLGQEEVIANTGTR